MKSLFPRQRVARATIESKTAIFIGAGRGI
jgi:hypothetical protein